MLKKVVILLFTLFLFSCPLFEEQGGSPKKEEPVVSEPIELTIISPVTNSEFGDSVTVSCLLSGNIGDIKSIGWTVSTPYTEILNEAVEIGNVDSKGLFSFTFPTKDYRSDLDIAINIENNAGEVVTKEIKLLFGGEISLTLSAEPGNGFVTLSWSKIEGITEYTAYYSLINDFINEEYYKEKKTITDNKVTFDSLKNGCISHFIIVGKDSTGKKYYSDIVSAVPHSTNTFTPVVDHNAERDAVTIYWNSYSDNVKYNVYRSNSTDGSYINISGDVDGRNYIDNNAHFGKTYFYKVTPTVNLTDHTSPMAIRFAYEKAPSPYTIDVQRDVSFIEIDGDYAYTLGSKKLVISDLKNLRKLYSLNLESRAKNLQVRGDYLYILMDIGIAVVKIKSSGSIVSPIHISTYSNPDLLNIYPYKSNYLLATTNQSLIVLDTTDSSLLNEVGRFDNSDTNRSFTTVVADETYAYIGTQSNTTEKPIVKRVSLQDPLNPVYTSGDDYILTPENRFTGTITESAINSNYLYFVGEGIDHKFHKENDLGKTNIPQFNPLGGYGDTRYMKNISNLKVNEKHKSYNTPKGLTIYKISDFSYDEDLNPVRYDTPISDFYNDKLVSVKNGVINIPPDWIQKETRFNLNALNTKLIYKTLYNNKLSYVSDNYIQEFVLDTFNKVIDKKEYKLPITPKEPWDLISNDKCFYWRNSEKDLVIMSRSDPSNIITKTIYKEYGYENEFAEKLMVTRLEISGDYLKLYLSTPGHNWDQFIYYYDLSTPTAPKKIDKIEGMKSSGEEILYNFDPNKNSSITNLNPLLHGGFVGNIQYYSEGGKLKYTEIDLNN